MATEAEALAILEAQRAYFASDQLLLDRAAAWRDVSPEDCLAETESACAGAMEQLQRVDDETLARVDALDALPADTIALLEAFRARSR